MRTLLSRITRRPTITEAERPRRMAALAGVAADLASLGDRIGTLEASR